MIVYLIYCPQSGKGYVGQTIHSLEHRWKSHCAKTKFGNTYPINQAIRKYGEAAFELSILAKASTLDELNNLEQHYIATYNTLSPNGYNLHTGGGNHKVLEETRYRMRESRKKQKCLPHTEEWKRQNGLRMMGNTHSKNHVGWNHSEETKAKIAASHRGRKRPPFSPEWKQALSLANKRRWAVTKSL